MGDPLVREVTESDTIEGIFSLRTEVFVVEQGVDPSVEFDGYDRTSIQIGAFMDGELVGCGRIRSVGGRAKLERIAVRSPYRRRGIGGAIVRYMIGISDMKGLRDQYLHSQTAVMGFYQRFGFIPQGDDFIEAGIPHRKMVLARS